MGRLFGSDGVRGVANAGLTCETILNIGRAAAAVLCESNPRPRVLIGWDTRASSEMMVAALTAGFCSVGADVECDAHPRGGAAHPRAGGGSRRGGGGLLHPV